MYVQQELSQPVIGNGLLATRKDHHNHITGKPGVYEYVLRAETGPLLDGLIQQEKQAFNSAYATHPRQKAAAGITIASFWAEEVMEETIIRWLQRICGQQQSFGVMLNNFSGFPPGSLYLRVQDPQPFQQLAAQLKVIDNYISSYGMPAVKIMLQPHVSIAHKIPGSIYTRAMMDYAQRDFNGSFLVNELLLMRRKHKKESWKKINVFGLLPNNAH
jgi:2'-5' RNA ligase superfamily